MSSSANYYAGGTNTLLHRQFSQALFTKVEHSDGSDEGLGSRLWLIATKTCLWGWPRQTLLGHVHVHDHRRGTFLLYWNDERIVVYLKRVGSFLSISYKVTHFYSSQPTSTIVSRLLVNPTTHDWTCPWPSKICPSCEWPICCKNHKSVRWIFMGVKKKKTSRKKST